MKIKKNFMQTGISWKNRRFFRQFPQDFRKIFSCSGSAICNFLQIFDKNSNFLQRLFIFLFLKKIGSFSDSNLSSENSRIFFAYIQESDVFIPYTRSTFPERRHLEQTYTWQGVPFTTAFTRFTLGFHVLLERLWEWDTLIPNVTPLPQNSHFAIFYCTSLNKLTDSIISYCNKKCKPFFSFFENFFWTSEICIFHLKK